MGRKRKDGEDVRRILDLRARGLSYGEIARRTGKTRQGVQYIVQSRGAWVRVRPPREEQRRTQERVLRFARRNRGVTPKEISVLFDLSVFTVRVILRRNGIPVRRQPWGSLKKKCQVYFKARDAAELMGISLTRLYYRVNTDRLPVVKSDGARPTIWIHRRHIEAEIGREAVLEHIERHFEAFLKHCRNGTGVPCSRCESRGWDGLGGIRPGQATVRRGVDILVTRSSAAARR